MDHFLRFTAEALSCARVSSVTDPVTGTTGYTYGLAGQRATMTLPGGGTWTYTAGTEIQPKNDPNSIGFAVGEIQDDGGRTVQFGVGMHGELCQVISNKAYNGTSLVSYSEADYYPDGWRNTSPASARLLTLTYANNAWTSKTLRIMGQVVRNFPGTLTRDRKRETVEQSYLLGLRTLQAVLAVVNQNLGSLRAFYGDVLKAVRAVPETELPDVVDGFLYSLIHSCAYGAIKHISRAGGSEHLQETYRELVRTASPYQFRAY